jgi:hypothetical protein
VPPAACVRDLRHQYSFHAAVPLSERDRRARASGIDVAETTTELRHSHAELQGSGRASEEEAARGSRRAVTGYRPRVRNPLAIIVNAVSSLKRQASATNRQMLSHRRRDQPAKPPGRQPASFARPSTCSAA